MIGSRDQVSDTHRALTYGEAAVGLTFNPSNDPNVQQAKQAFANIIDLLHDLRLHCNSFEAREMYTIAIRDAQAAQMWGVKAITWPRSADNTVSEVAGRPPHLNPHEELKRYG